MEAMIRSRREILWMALLSLLFSQLQACAFYNPTIGKWLSRDPVGHAGGITLYGFIKNEPVSDNDPLGLCSRDACGPDITDRLRNEIRNNQLDPRVIDIAERYRHLRTFMQALVDFANLVRTGGEYDFKRFLADDMAYQPGRPCPSRRCAGYVTLCGACYTYEVAANIHY